MKPIDQDSVPATFDEAVRTFVSLLTEEDKKQIRKMKPSDIHFGLGMYMRNSWSMWEKDSPLVVDFRNKFKLFGHGDDVSGLLFHCVWREVKGLPWEAEPIADRFRHHWIKAGLDPYSGEMIKK